MRTLLGILFLFAFVSFLPAQNFEGMAYVKAGGELIGPVKVKQNVGGSISIGEWPKTTFFVFDEYTAVLDENKNLLFEGGLPANATPGEKFTAEKEKWLNSNFTPAPPEEVVTETQVPDEPEPDKKTPRKKRKKEPRTDKEPQPEDLISTSPIFPTSDTSPVSAPYFDRDPRFGFGLTAGHFKTGGVDGCGYGLTVERSYPLGRRFRVGAAADVIAYHDFIFKKTMTQVFYDDMGYPVGEESYKFPEGFAGAFQLRPFAGVDFGCVRAGYQPVLAVNYHSIWGTNVDVFPLGIGAGFLRGPVQVSLYYATELSSNMYYGRMRVFGASLTYGNSSAKREDF